MKRLPELPRRKKEGSKEGKESEIISLHYLHSIDVLLGGYTRQEGDREGKALGTSDRTMIRKER